MEEYLPVISATTALLAVVVGPWIAYKVAILQIRSTVISTNRQAWIDSLREDVAEFANIVCVIGYHGQMTSVEDGHARIARIERASYYYQKICLRLNPMESSHLEFSRLLESLTSLALKSDGAECQLAEAVAEVHSKAREILKNEWERVKRGD